MKDGLPACDTSSQNDVGINGWREDETPLRALAVTATGRTACPHSSTDQTAGSARLSHMEWCFYRSGHFAKPYSCCASSNWRVLHQCTTIAEARSTRGRYCALSRSLAYSKSIFERGCIRSLSRTHTRLCCDGRATTLALLQLRSLRRRVGSGQLFGRLRLNLPHVELLVSGRPESRVQDRKRLRILFLIDEIQSRQLYYLLQTLDVNVDGGLDWRIIRLLQFTRDCMGPHMPR